MKKRTLLFSMMIIMSISLFIVTSSHEKEPIRLFLANIESFAADESAGEYTCTATTKCYNMIGQEDGSVSCSGDVCSRGSDWSGNRWVECDGRRTSC